jgi:hypothetical protein
MGPHSYGVAYHVCRQVAANVRHSFHITYRLKEKLIRRSTHYPPQHYTESLYRVLKVHTLYPTDTLGHRYSRDSCRAEGHRKKDAL